ncbi:hypothetical protein [Mesorhizobium xinjiangense]|uniref:hypothetical protein n=1 Tax=Mesorhizobium xinjiangense TaxID=2678685 RepID=UPI001F26DAD8|nr:hypothetical protein [Mesorhizobium xinjiangense]
MVRAWSPRRGSNGPVVCPSPELQPERLEVVLSSVLDRRQERTERRREHLAELHRRITETDQRLNRLYDAIESGVANLDDPALKERIAGLKALRDQAQSDADRIEAALGSAGNQVVTPEMIGAFAHKARERLRLENGGYRRDHLRALAQRVEVADKEVRIMGSKSELLRTLVAACSGQSAAFGVHSSVCPSREKGDSSFRRHG